MGVTLSLTAMGTWHSFDGLNLTELSKGYRSEYQELEGLCALTAAGVAIQGYHLGIEDQAICVPSILRHLDPSLFPRDAYFFESQTRPMLLDEMVVWFARLTHVSVPWALFGFHLQTIFLLLLACYRIARRCFEWPGTTWAGVAMITVMLTLPCRRTARTIMVFGRGPSGGKWRTSIRTRRCMPYTLTGAGMAEESPCLVGWNQFTAKDFERWYQDFGLSWSVKFREEGSGACRKIRIVPTKTPRYPSVTLSKLETGAESSEVLSFRRLEHCAVPASMDDEILRP